MPSEKPIIQKETVVGINTDVKSVHLIDDDQVLYCCGNHVLIWNRHTKKQSFLYQCGNSEEIQSIVLFCSRNLVAICVEKMEKGLYVIIFNLCTLKRKKLLKFQNEDEKRIVDISFTLDGKHCLVLHGAPNFLLALWNIEKMPKSVATVRLATPSGKQLTKASIRPVLGDNNEMIVCASGLGIIRFFKMFDGIFRPITVNLRRELQNYIVHCWLSNDTCVLGTDTNEIIVMQNFVTKAVVTIDGWNQNITTMLGFSHGLVIGGTRGSIRLYACVEDKGFMPEFSKEFMLDDKDVPNVIAIDIAATEEMCLCLLNNGKICSVPLTDDTITIDHKIVPCLHNVGKNGIPHITCMAACLLKPIIALGGSDRSLNIWNFDINDFELKVTLESNIVGISLHPNSLQILICLENHVELSYIHREAFSPVWRKDLQTNGSSSFSNGGQCFALVCGQFVQVYDTHTFNPISTLRGHTGPIQSLSWNQDGQEIATIGTDSIICVWNVLNGKRRVRHVNDAMSYKNGCFNKQLDCAFLNVLNVQNTTGSFDRSTSSFTSATDLPPKAIVKCLAEDMIFGTYSDASLIGVVWFCTFGKDASTVFRHQKRLHSKRISHIIFSRSHLFSASDDGSMCVCEIHLDNVKEANTEVHHITMKHFLVPTNSLIEKDNTIQQLIKELEELKIDHDQETKHHISLHKQRVLNLQEEFDSATESIIKQRKANEVYTENHIQHLQRMQDSQVKEFKLEIDEVKGRHQHEKITKINKMEHQLATQKEEVHKLESELETLKKKHTQEEESMINEFEDSIQQQTEKYQSLSLEKAALISSHQEIIEAMEEDAQKEFEEEMASFTSTLLHEKKVAMRIKEENDITKKKYDAIMRDYEEHSETIASLKDKQHEIMGSIDSLQISKSNGETEISDLERKLKDVNIEINNATEEIHKMERSKLNQRQQINSLRNAFLSKEADLKALNDQTDEIDMRLKIAQQECCNLRLKVENAEHQNRAITKEVERKKKEVKMKASEEAILRKKLNDLSNYSDNFNLLKKNLVALYHEYGDHGQSSKCSMGDGLDDQNFNERKSNLIKKKIEKTLLIIEKNRILHHSQVSKLKRDRCILDARLKKVEAESKRIAQRQANTLNDY